MSQESKWYNLSTDEAIETLQSTHQGLTEDEAKRRLAELGPNELKEKKKTSALTLLLEQFKDFLIIILLVAAIISFVLAIMGEGDMLDPILIVVIVLFAAILGFVQEFRSEKAMEALKQMTAPTATTIRNDEEKEIPSRELVPGDIVLLEAGDRVPADSRLIEAVSLRIDEAALTGESAPVDKMTQVIPGSPSIGDRKNMAYTGTTAVYGRGKAIITATGMSTEFGKIAGLLQEGEAPETPLQVNLNKVGKVLGIACLVICAVVAVVGLIAGLFANLLAAFIWAVSLAVAAVPEALPAVVTICLALGVQRMAKRHSLVRRLPAVETLGCTTFICSDKTGTLTQNQMTVRKIFTDDKLIDISGVGYEPKGTFSHNATLISLENDPCFTKLLYAAVLCNDSHLLHNNGNWEVRGDPTEGALVVLGAKGGIKGSDLDAPRIDEIPFSSERKQMTTIHEVKHKKIAYSKGAPEVILESCSHIFSGGKEKDLDELDRQKILKASHEMATSALRVLGLSYKPLATGDSMAGDPYKHERIECRMVWLGLVGMIDPPREEVKDAVARCKQAGIVSVMITGDHMLTAKAIATELGILTEGEIVLSGNELDKLSESELDAIVDKIKVYARVSPEHKMRTVKALQAKQQIVAMTGDGVNDAPALQKADIGIAMGITGTDVSKEAGAMILTDDNFASIVAAVEEGRNIFSNIRKFLMYLLSCNIGEILLMLVAFIIATASGQHVLPLVALQILVVNLVTDGLPALALAVDPGDPDVMQRPPRKPNQSIFDRIMLGYLSGLGFWTMLATLGVFLWAIFSGKTEIEAQCLTFATLCVVELANCLNCRSERHSIFRIGLFTNLWLILAIVISFLITLAIIYLPFLQEPFHTYPMTLSDWVIPVIAGISIILVVEITKLIMSRQNKTTNS
jgi:P-type Ca2+ transporter type 2C